MKRGCTYTHWPMSAVSIPPSPGPLDTEGPLLRTGNTAVIQMEVLTALPCTMLQVFSLTVIKTL